jgi:surface antigen
MRQRLADPEKVDRVESYASSGAQEAGDDYPWFYEASDDEGGGLSPLGYYYRECVDFVAWRLNRDAGSVSAPYRWTWSNMTPSGGNASEWAYAWESHGWPTGIEPVAGSVAWFAGNHVAYVKAVLEDGQVLIEEYNHGMSHKYGQRIIPATSVALFLYAPPA